MTLNRFGIDNAGFSFGRFDAGRLTNTGRCPSASCVMVCIVAGTSNTGIIYVGGSNVSSTQGIPLSAGISTGWIPVNNLDLLYIAKSVAGDVVNYMIVR